MDVSVKVDQSGDKPIAPLPVPVHCGAVSLPPAGTANLARPAQRGRRRRARRSDFDCQAKPRDRDFPATLGPQNGRPKREPLTLRSTRTGNCS